MNNQLALIETLTDDSLIKTDGFEERISVDDVSSEMNGLQARFLQNVTVGSRRFCIGAVEAIQNWNGNAAEALIDGVSVSKTSLAPEPPAHADVRRYNLNLAGQRRAVLQNRAALSGSMSAARRTELNGRLRHREREYSRMWIRQMMYNRFDPLIAHWTTHYNTALSPSIILDPNIPKSMFFQETRMGTSGFHMNLPPYDWTDGDKHPIKSRFNLGQAIDSWGPQQWLMMREMAPTIFSSNGLGAFAARARWMGMRNSDYAAHAGFMRAFRQFFEARTSGNNLMGSPGIDLHEDYGFWIRTAIRWLFVKFSSRSVTTWSRAVRRYNGGGTRAQRYEREVMARVSDLTVYNASESFTESATTDIRDAAPVTTADESVATLGESGPDLDRSARLTWQNLHKMRDSRGNRRLFYVVTGAPTRVARAGQESHAVFNLHIENSNSVYNHKDVETKARLLDILPGRRFRQAYPPPSSRRRWNVRRQPSLEDDSSRLLPVLFPRSALMEAYNSNSPGTRVELEYHWRETWEDSQEHYNRTGLDFVLVAPYEFMLSQKVFVETKRFDSPGRHKNDYWIPVSRVDFGPSIRQPVSVRYDVTSTLSRSGERRESTSSSQSRSATRSDSRSNTFSATISAETGRETSASASIDILTLGIKQMFKVGGSITSSNTTSSTMSSTVASEFAQSLVLSSGYRAAQSTASSTAITVSPPTSIGPSGTGPGRTGGSRSSVGVYLYPIVVYYRVPYTHFHGVNRFGQVTRRDQGHVHVPYIREWGLIAD